MDELYQKRFRNTHNRTASVSEKHTANFSSNQSPQILSNFSSLVQGNELKKISDHPFAQSAVLPTNTKVIKIKKKAIPSPQSANKFHLDQFLSNIEKSKVGALSLRIDTPTSGRKSYSSVEKPMTRTQSRVRKDSKEVVEKITTSSHFHHTNRRAVSNPRVSPSEASYSAARASGKDSFEKAKKLYLGEDAIAQEDVKLAYLKQAWMPLNAASTSLTKPGLPRKSIRLSEKKDQNSFRDKKAGYKQNQQAMESNFLSNFSQLEKSYIKLKNSSHCVDIDEQKSGSNLGKDLQKLGFRIKQENLPRKVVLEEKLTHKSQEPQLAKENNNVKDFIDSKISKASKVTRLEDKDTIFNVRPLDTEEVYEDFFNTSKLQFDFEKTMVSLRSEKFKDQYSAEPKRRRPSINRMSHNRKSEREIPLDRSSSRPFEDKNLFVKNFG